MTDRDRLRDLLRARAIKTGDFTLASGRKSSYYADCRLATLWPESAFLVGKLMHERLAGRGLAAVGGPALAAVPVVSAIAIASHLAGSPLPAFVVRKEAKQHGTTQLIEGPFPTGERVAVVDDTLTTGGSLFHAIEAVEAAGTTVGLVMTILDRQEGGAEKIRLRGYEYESLFTISDLGITPNPPPA